VSDIDGDLLAEVMGRDTLPKRLRQLDELLRRKGIDLTDLESAQVRSVGFWQAMHKDENTGDAVVTDLARIEIAPGWDSGPEWPVIQPAPMLNRAKRAKQRTGKGWRKYAALPDMQIGYWRGADGVLVPTHDEDALAIALGIVAHHDPDVVVLHGDNMDLPDMSRFRSTPAFAQTTQATVDRCALLAQQLREAAPRASIQWLAGNHEERLANYILDNAKAAFGLKRGREPQGWPVLSVPHLCHLDDVDVTYLPGYPANRYDLNDGLRMVHGDRTGPAGTVAAKYLSRSHKSVMFGHIHSHDEAELTNEDGWQVWAGSAGCLCRVDGGVPSTHSGVDLDGLPLPVHESWQQGLFVGEYRPDSRAFTTEHIAIRHAWARWSGKEWTP
jgi:hypothetical protein